MTMMRLSECKENVFSFAEREHLRRCDGKGTAFILYRKRFIENFKLV
jgi:hypothetical protein